MPHEPGPVPGPLPDAQDEHQHLRELLDHNSDWVWEVDAQGRYTYASGMVSQLLGVAPEQVLGKTPFDFMPPAEAARVGEAFGAIVAAQRPFAGLVNRNQHADGRIVVLETSGVPLFDAQGQLRGYRGIDRDISALGERVLQLEAVYDSASIALCTLNRSGQLVMLNRAMAQLLGGDAQALTGTALASCMPAAWAQLEADFVAMDQGQALQGHELGWNGQWFFVTPRALRDARGEAVGLSTAWMDITARKLAEQRLTEANRLLAHYAQQDYLTGLFNRRYLDEQLVREVARARRDGQPLSLCMADVDHFKRYNDSLGHLAGDDCLRAVARALSLGTMRPGDTVSRYGGEEFVVVLPATDAAGAQTVAERMRTRVAALGLPHAASPLGQVTISVGVVSCQPGPKEAPTAEQDAKDAATAARLLRAADEALYRAKNQGRNGVAAHRLATP